MHQNMPIAERVRAHLAELGLRVDVYQIDGALRLLGAVNSQETLELAGEVTASLAAGLFVQNDLTIESERATPGPVPMVPSVPTEGFEEPLPREGALELEPDFARGPTTESEDLEGAEPVFVPTDPVITTDEHGRAEILGGFGTDSMAEIEVEPSAEDALPGDEALAEAVQRELREDAATHGLGVDAFVRRGVVHLRGWVPDLEDADNAEAVASRVPGVREVIDETDWPRL